jgi:adenylate kinase
MENGKKKIFIFLGPPGSGKGTQTDLLAPKLKLPAVSPGELLRSEAARRISLSKKEKKIMEQGGMVDNKIVGKLLDRRLGKTDARRGVIFDGFPRNLAQTDYLEKKFSGFDPERYDLRVFYIHIGDREIKRRLSSRRVCLCGATYHLLYNPPKKKDICDVCGRILKARPDDRLPAIDRRLKIFHRENNPLLNYFSSRKVLYRINGEQPIARVQADILKVLKR